MSKQNYQKHESESKTKPNLQSGAKEILTLSLARKIVRMIEQFPDANISVTWDNVTRQTKSRFGIQFRRNVLSQKAWDGRKLIAEAFQDAKEVQRRQAHDTAPKYANEPRSRLRLIVVKLQSELLALREQLDQVRAQQYDEIHSLLDTRTPLNQLLELKAEPSLMHFDKPEDKINRQTVPSRLRKPKLVASDGSTIKETITKRPVK